MLLVKSLNASAEVEKCHPKPCIKERKGQMKLRVDEELKRAKEGPQQSEKPQEKPETRTSKIVRGIITVILVGGLLVFMVYMFLNR